MFFLCLWGCSPHSSEEFHREGIARCQSLVQDLKKIESREDLLQAEPRLKKHFESLVSLMIEVRKFHQKNLTPMEEECFIGEEKANGDLEGELRRVYLIEGGREVIERAQQEALIRLDAHERILRKRAERIPKSHCRAS